MMQVAVSATVTCVADFLGGQVGVPEQGEADLMASLFKSASLITCWTVSSVFITRQIPRLGASIVDEFQGFGPLAIFYLKSVHVLPFILGSECHSPPTTSRVVLWTLL